MGDPYLVPDIARPDSDEMSRSDAALSEACYFLENRGVLVFASVGTVIAVWLFYRNKLQTPLHELERAFEKVADGALYLPALLRKARRAFAAGAESVRGARAMAVFATAKLLNLVCTFRHCIHKRECE